jgi:hypothetical protein
MPLQDPLSQLLSGSAAAAAAPAAAPSSSQMVVFDQDGLRVTFNVTPVPGVPGATAVQAVAVNSGLDDVTEFNLQVRCPVGGGAEPEGEVSNCRCAVRARPGRGGQQVLHASALCLRLAAQGFGVQISHC